MKKEKVEYKTEYCKYSFSPEEMRDIAEQLAIKTQEADEIEKEKKSITASFKERIERTQGEIKGAARRYKDGYEMRDIECIVERDFETGVVKYIRTDTGEVARISKMTMAERQLKIEDVVKTDEPEPVETDEEIRQRQDTERFMRSESSSIA